MKLFPAFEEFGDKFVKEFKEFPGWVLVILTCKYLGAANIIPWAASLLAWLDSEVTKEEGTVVQALALTVFMLGDIVDTWAFPREASEEGDERWADTLRSLRLLFAGWGLLLLIAAPWEWSSQPVVEVRVVCLFVFVVLLQVKTTGGPSRETGWKWVGKPVLGAMEGARRKARQRLGIEAGVYSVTKALATSAGEYRWRPMIENELAKFLRSAFLPLLGWSVWFTLSTEWWRFGAALAGCGLSFFAYGALKADHMRLLYARVQAVPELNYRCEDLPKADHNKSPLRVFLWNDKVVAFADRSKMAAECRRA